MVHLATLIASVVEALLETFFGRQAALDEAYVLSVPITPAAPNHYSVEATERQPEIDNVCKPMRPKSTAPSSRRTSKAKGPG